jgi:hypothetical protein
MKKATSSLLLLDVNVLLALAWPNHQFHAPVTELMTVAEPPWATCAVTQLGFIRLSSNPAVVGVAKSPADAAALLKLMVQHPRHRYLESLPSPTSVEFDRILGNQQVTDAYLLWLAEHHGAKLLTFDSRLKALGTNCEVLAP